MTRDLTNHIYINTEKNRELIILGDDGVRVEIYSRKAGVWPDVESSKGIFLKKDLIDKIGSKVVQLQRIANIVLQNSLKI